MFPLCPIHVCGELIMNTQKENFNKPGGYSREQHDEFNHDSRLAPGTSSQFNNMNVSFKGITYCYYCEKTKYIEFDRHKDEIYCFDCGTVLRQGFNDYGKLIQNIKKVSEELGTDNFSSHRNKDYQKELLEIQDYKKRVGLKKIDE